MDATQSQLAGDSVEIDLQDVGFFANVLTLLLPGAGEVGSIPGASGSAPWNRRRMSSVDVGTCVYVNFDPSGVRLRGVSKSKDVFTELYMPASFFHNYDYPVEKHISQGDTRSGCIIMVHLRQFLNVLRISGESAHLRLRYSFTDCVISLLLQQPLQQQCQELFSEFAIKTFEVPDMEEPLDVRAFFSEDSNRDFVLLNPLVFREVLQDLLGDEEGGARVSLHLQPSGPQHKKQRQNTSLHSSPDGETSDQSPLLSIEMEQSGAMHLVSLEQHPSIFPKVSVAHPHKHEYLLKGILSLVPPLKLAHGLRLEFSEEGYLLAQILLKPEIHTRLLLYCVILPSVSTAHEDTEKSHEAKTRDPVTNSV